MKRILMFALLVGLAVCGGWAYSSWNNYLTNAKTARFNEDVDDLFYALQKYKEYVGSYPIGNNADVVKALAGNNSQKVIVDVGRHKNLNSKGELVDPWGTPFRIYFSGDGVLIRSAGPNKRFDDSTVPNSDDFYRSN
jgi:hypothetical protein